MVQSQYNNVYILNRLFHAPRGVVPTRCSATRCSATALPLRLRLDFGKCIPNEGSIEAKHFGTCILTKTKGRPLKLRCCKLVSRFPDQFSKQGHFRQPETLRRGVSPGCIRIVCRSKVAAAALRSRRPAAARAVATLSVSAATTMRYAFRSSSPTSAAVS
jgi:hypothetical protein